MSEQTKREWATLRSLHGRKRLEQIWTYYKLPILIGLILVYIAGYLCYRQLTKKENLLYLALVNLSPGSQLTQQLTEEFAQQQGFADNERVYLYTDLLLSEQPGADEEYVYACEMRIMAAISAQRMDLVLMDAEARDLFSENGYLADLSELDSSLSGRWIELSGSSLIQQAGFPQEVYLGVLANAPHPEQAAAYIHYLFQDRKETNYGHFDDR